MDEKTKAGHFLATTNDFNAHLSKTHPLSFAPFINQCYKYHQ